MQTIGCIFLTRRIFQVFSRLVRGTKPEPVSKPPGKIKHCKLSSLNQTSHWDFVAKLSNSMLWYLVSDPESVTGRLRCDGEPHWPQASSRPVCLSGRIQTSKSHHSTNRKNYVPIPFRCSLLGTCACRNRMASRSGARDRMIMGWRTHCTVRAATLVGPARQPTWLAPLWFWRLFSIGLGEGQQANVAVSLFTRHRRLGLLFSASA